MSYSPARRSPFLACLLVLLAALSAVNTTRAFAHGATKTARTTKTRIGVLRAPVAVSCLFLNQTATSNPFPPNPNAPTGDAHWEVTYACNGVSYEVPYPPDPTIWSNLVTFRTGNGYANFWASATGDWFSEFFLNRMIADSTGTVTPILTWTPGYLGDPTLPPSRLTYITLFFLIRQTPL